MVFVEYVNLSLALAEEIDIYQTYVNAPNNLGKY